MNKMIWMKITAFCPVWRNICYMWVIIDLISLWSPLGYVGCRLTLRVFSIGFKEKGKSALPWREIFKIIPLIGKNSKNEIASNAENVIIDSFLFKSMILVYGRKFLIMFKLLMKWGEASIEILTTAIKG